MNTEQSSCSKCVCCMTCPIWVVPVALLNLLCISRCICGGFVGPIQEETNIESQCCCCYRIKPQCYSACYE